jgi:hypothetical protein
MYKEKIKYFRIRVVEFVNTKLMNDISKYFEIWGMKYISIYRMKLFAKEFCRIKTHQKVHNVCLL